MFQRPKEGDPSLAGSHTTGDQKPSTHFTDRSQGWDRWPEPLWIPYSQISIYLLLYSQWPHVSSLIQPYSLDSLSWTTWATAWFLYNPSFLLKHFAPYGLPPTNIWLHHSELTHLIYSWLCILSPFLVPCISHDPICRALCMCIGNCLLVSLVPWLVTLETLLMEDTTVHFIPSMMWYQHCSINNCVINFQEQILMFLKECRGDNDEVYSFKLEVSLKTDI